MKKKLEDMGKKYGKSVSFNVNNETYLSMLKIAYELNLSFSEYIRKCIQSFVRKIFPLNIIKLILFFQILIIKIEISDDTIIRIMEEYDLNSIKKEIQKRRSF